MERQKKLLSLVLALVMLFTTAIVAVVAEEPTVISTETVAVTASYSMFKIDEIAVINTYSDGSQELVITYKGSSFTKMYLGTDKTNIDDSLLLNPTKLSWHADTDTAISDNNDRYTFAIPMTKSGNDTDTIDVFVLSKKNTDWSSKGQKCTLTVGYLSGSKVATVSDDSDMFTTAETGSVNSYSNGINTLEFFLLSKKATSAYHNIYGKDAATANSDYKTQYLYSAEATGNSVDDKKEYKFEMPLPTSGNTLSVSNYSTKRATWQDITVTYDYIAETKDVTAVVEYDVFTIEQPLTAGVYLSGSLEGAIKYPDSAITKAFLGTATDAANAEDSALILPVDGKFTIPVSALDTEIAVAVYNGTKWINTTVIFTTTTDDDTNGGDNTENGNTGGDNTGGANTDVTVTPNVIPSDGTYTIDVTSNNNMFKVVACNLKVVDGKITATVTLSGTGYDKLFLGTKTEAPSAASAEYIKYAPDSNGKYTYTFDIDSLDKPIEVAAHSTKNSTWYDRTLTFDSSTLRLVAEGSTNTNTSAGTGSSTTTEENKNLSASDIENMLNKADKTEKTSDGTYKPSFGFTGGSGRTSISCNKVVVKDGKATATIVFDSETFTWVQVDGVKYYNQNKGGNSTFVIPVIINDKTPIVAQTVGMSQPHEIEYMLYCFIDGTKAPASTPPIETTTDENTENGKSEDVKDDGNSWGSFDEESVDNEVETGTAENASGISGSLIFIIVAVAFAVGAVAFLVSKKKRG